MGEEEEDEWDEEYDSEEGEWDDEDDDDEGAFSLQDDFGAVAAGGGGDEKSPFAPAEEYGMLSDMLDDFGRAYTGFEDGEMSDDDGEDEEAVEARAHPANHVQLAGYLVKFFQHAN